MHTYIYITEPLTQSQKPPQNHSLKVIPRCVEGPWMVKAAVGSTPAIMGTKICHTYHRLENAFEVRFFVCVCVWLIMD
jgi:hypothetical protein